MVNNGSKMNVQSNLQRFTVGLTKRIKKLRVLWSLMINKYFSLLSVYNIISIKFQMCSILV